MKSRFIIEDKDIKILKSKNSNYTPTEGKLNQLYLNARLDSLILKNRGPFGRPGFVGGSSTIYLGYCLNRGLNQNPYEKDKFGITKHGSLQVAWNENRENQEAPKLMDTKEIYGNKGVALENEIRDKWNDKDKRDEWIETWIKDSRDAQKPGEPILLEQDAGKNYVEGYKDAEAKRARNGVVEPTNSLAYQEAAERLISRLEKENPDGFKVLITDGGTYSGKTFVSEKSQDFGGRNVKEGAKLILDIAGENNGTYVKPLIESILSKHNKSGKNKVEIVRVEAPLKEYTKEQFVGRCRDKARTNDIGQTYESYTIGAQNATATYKAALNGNIKGVKGLGGEGSNLAFTKFRQITKKEQISREKEYLKNNSEVKKALRGKSDKEISVFLMKNAGTKNPVLVTNYSDDPYSKTNKISITELVKLVDKSFDNYYSKGEWTNKKEIQDSKDGAFAYLKKLL